MRFNKDVRAFGYPTLTFELDDGETRTAGHVRDRGNFWMGLYTPIKRGDTLVFDYVVQAGDRDSNGISIPADSISGKIRSSVPERVTEGEVNIYDIFYAMVRQPVGVGYSRGRPDPRRGGAGVQYESEQLARRGVSRLPQLPIGGRQEG